MLVLTCKDGESVYIGDDIMIRIRETKRGSAKVIIDAPREVPIQREALRNRIQATKARRRADQE